MVAVMGVGRQAVFSENVTGAPPWLYLMNEEGQPGSRKVLSSDSYKSKSQRDEGFRVRFLEPSLSLGG